MAPQLFFRPTHAKRFLLPFIRRARRKIRWRDGTDNWPFHYYYYYFPTSFLSIAPDSSTNLIRGLVKLRLLLPLNYRMNCVSLTPRLHITCFPLSPPPLLLLHLPTSFFPPWSLTRVCLLASLCITHCAHLCAWCYFFPFLLAPPCSQLNHLCKHDRYCVTPRSKRKKLNSGGVQ